MSTSRTTAETKSEESDTMGVASLTANKRRLETPDVGDEDYVAAKVAKRAELIESSAVTSEVQDTIIGSDNTNSDFLATSILARTLLTSTGSAIQCSPLESLCSTLEALPAPSLLLDGTDDIRSTFLTTFKTTIHETTELEFNSLLCHERPLSTVTVLSPIDADASDWSPGGPGSSSSTANSAARKPTKGSVLTCISSNVVGNGSSGSSSGDQVITEDETGKSYYNLGSADTTISVKKNSSSSTAMTAAPSPLPTLTVESSSNAENGWTNNGCNNNSSTDFHDDGSSSSCESISSEDLFTSEEFDASEDEEEIRSYKQQRSTVLHLSLCKLNSFRTQQCVEPSLHRSVLICNTLRHIEQEIRNEDEIPARAPQPLPPFWGSQNLNNNPPGPPVNSSGGGGGIPPVNVNPNNMNQPQITDVRPNAPSLVGPLHGHDPYLSSNNYATTNSAETSPYNINYDYSSLRPHPTPFHTASGYEYEHDLPLVSGSPATGPLLDVSSPPSLLECDSGYAEDLNLSSYYYNTPPRTGISSHSDSPGSNTSASSTTASRSPPGETYLNCGYSSLTIGDSPVCTAPGATPTNTESLLSDSSLLSPASDMSDIEIHHNSLNLPPATIVESRSNCDYMNNNNNNQNNNSTSGSSSSNNSPSSSSSTSSSSSSSSSSSDSSESENSVSPPPSSLIMDSSASSNNSSNLCWSNKLCPSSVPPAISSNMIAMNNKEITSDSSLLQQQKHQQHHPFASQESHQCGMESRLTEFNRSHPNFNNPHHHNLPMDSLISANYSDSL